MKRPHHVVHAVPNVLFAVAVVLLIAYLWSCIG